MAKKLVEESFKVGDKVMFQGMGPLTVIHADEQKVEALSLHMRVTVYPFDKIRFERVPDVL